jgi:hypothetical protein
MVTCEIIPRSPLLRLTPSSEHPFGPGLNREAFFLVTNIEYDVAPAREATNPDNFAGAPTGELGCWAEFTKTRILRAGDEQSDVPGYWDIGMLWEVTRPISKNFQGSAPMFSVIS